MNMIDPSILELFRTDLEGQIPALTEGLLTMERAPQDARQLEALMRAAHSLKGAARMTGLDVLARVAHSMEDCFVAAQHGKIILQRPQVDLLLEGVDLMSRIGHTPEDSLGKWSSENKGEVDALVEKLCAL